ncbi:MAG: MATE family efflux transporter [Flavobacteriaceae bacterium]
MAKFFDYTKEFKYNLTLSYPVTIGLLGHTIVQLIDNIMVGKLGTSELAAVSLGNSFILIAMSLGIGFSTAITPLVSESIGKKNNSEKSFLNQGLLLCLFLGFLMFIIVYNLEDYLFFMGQSSDVVYLAYSYLKWVSISLIPLITFQAFKQFTDGLSMTRPAMYATVFSNFINIILNYILIFGKFGFPSLGIEGAALGTLIARFSSLIFIIFYFYFHSNLHRYLSTVTRINFNFKILKKIILLGFPSALQMFFEVFFFIAAIWMSGLLGKNEQASNQIALNLSSMTFMVAMGFSVVAMIRIGEMFGKSDIVNLKRIAYSLFLIIFLFDSFFCVLFLLFNEHLPWIYLSKTGDKSISDVFQVIEISSKLIMISGFFQIFDGLQAVVLGALRGIQDVFVPTVLIFIAYILVGLPLSYYLGLNTHLGVVGIWIGLLVGLVSSSIFLLLRFRYDLNFIFNKR